MTITINKWGNSLGIRIPKDIAQKANLKAGTTMTIGLDDEGKLILKEAKELTLDDLCSGVTPENKHDLIFDNEVGKEKWTY